MNTADSHNGYQEEPPRIPQPMELPLRCPTSHALDQMQARGITPSVVENTVQNGARSAGNTAAEIVHYDTVNNVTVVTDASSGRVVTVYGGRN